MIYPRRSRFRMQRRIWRLLRRMFRLFFCLSLCLLLCIGVFSVSASAAADPVVVIPAFGSEDPTTTYQTGLMPGWQPAQQQFLFVPQANVFGLPHVGEFPAAPRVAFSYGGRNNGTGLYRDFVGLTPPVKSVARWDIDLDDYDFSADGVYRLEMGQFWALTASSNDSLGIVGTILVGISVRNAYWEEVASKTWLYGSGGDRTPVFTGVYNVVEFAGYYDSLEDDDEFFLAFAGPSEPGYTLAIEVQVLAGAAGAGGLASGPNTLWFAFDDFEVVGFPEGDPDAEWKDEQRGLWARLWEFLTGMWDSIKEIPEKIAQLPQMILDGIKSLFIPEDGELEELMEDFKSYAEGKLGFVAQLVGLVPAVIGPMVDAGGGDVVVVLPRVYLSPAYGGIELWHEQGLNLTQVINGNNWLSLFYGMYKVLASVLLLGLILRYLYRVMHDILEQREEE